MSDTSPARGWVTALRNWARRPASPALRKSQSVGLALGGGFARGIAHVGVLRVFEKYGIPVSYIGGVSAGSIVAAAYASGATVDEIAKVGSVMRFTDVARWTISRMGLAGSERMNLFLQKLVKHRHFENRSEEHTSELQSLAYLVCRLLLEKK